MVLAAGHDNGAVRVMHLLLPGQRTISRTSLDQLRYCGRHLGGQLGAEAEVAADYRKDREPCGQAPEHPGQLHGVAEADAV